METRCCIFFSPNYSKKKSAEDSRIAAMGKTGDFFLFLFLILLVHADARGGICAFTLKIVNTLIKNSSRDDGLSISSYNQPTTKLLRAGQGW